MKHLDPIPTRRRRTRLIAATAFGVVTAVVGAGLASAATTQPSTPSTPGSVAPRAVNDPEPLFSDDFESEMTDAPVMLDQYVGAAGGTYSADPAWVNPNSCNGIVLNAAARPPAGSPGCVAPTMLSALANVLGQVSGVDPASNHVVTAYTEGNPGADKVQLESVRPIAVPGSGRFISFGVDAAAVNCFNNHPLLDFSLLDGDTEHHVSSSPIDPCSAAESKTYTVGGVTVNAGRFTSNGGILVDSDSLRFNMRNAQGSGGGNDGAIDTVRIVDSTPTLTTSFDGTAPIVGDTARLTLTVENTSENGRKPGWSFTETLPAGLRLAADPKMQTTCADPTVTAAGGSSSIAVQGDLATGAPDCTISVDVASETPGTYTVDDSTVTERHGLDLSSSSTVTFAPEVNALTVAEHPLLAGGNDDTIADLGETVTFTYRVTNQGNVAVRDVALTSSIGAVTCTDGVLAPGASTDCTAPAHTVTQADVDAGTIDGSATVAAVSRAGAAVSANAASTVPTTEQAAATGIDLAATIVGDAKPGVGDQVGLRVVVRNTGNVTLHDVRAAVVGKTGLTIGCPTDTLAPGAEAVCEVTGKYTVTQADVDRGMVDFGADTTAVGPKGQPVTATATVRQETVEAAPAVVQTLSAQLVDTVAAKPGDRVTLRTTIENTGNVTLHDVTGAMSDAGLTVGCVDDTLAPGTDTDCVVRDHVLTQADIDAGRVDFTVTSSGTAPSGVVVRADATAGITVPQVASVATEVVAHLAASDHDVPVAGDRVAVSVRVTNTGSVTLHDVGSTVGDGTALDCATTDVAPGQAVDCAAADRVLTQEDIDRGTVEFTARTTGTAPQGAEVDAEDSVTVGLDAKAGLFLEGDWETSREGAVQPGDTVAASFRVTNTSNVTAKAITFDTTGLGEVTCSAEELAPGATTECAPEQPMVVTDADASDGAADFSVVAKGEVGRADGKPETPTAPTAPATTGAIDTVSSEHAEVVVTTGSQPGADENVGSGPVFVFSNHITEEVEAEPAPVPAPTPVVLAFTGSDVLRTGGPLAALLVVLGGALLFGATRRRAARAARVDEPTDRLTPAE